ncbi:MAG: ABC transporter permease [Spirochaetaceae bacterium]|jgi:simple sugar transport system permease protein|nr:ABC transporter permease [Spirochaetaceae bacterium]
MIRVASRPELTGFREKLQRALAIAAALAASALFILLIGYNPLDVFAKIIAGSLGTAYRFRETIHKAIPLGILSLGTAVAFKMKFWNIGQEGQFYLGAYGASLIAFSFPDMPSPLLLTFMFLAGFVFGGLWALIPALLKARFSTSETLVTLMLNYVAVKWISYLQYGPWKDPQGLGFPKIASFSRNAVPPNLFGIHLGWVITLCLAALVYLLLKRTKLGYEIDVLGESEATARYAGIPVFRVMIAAILISGGLCGAAGMLQASAVERSLSDQLSGGLGFTSVITTWLARLNPLSIIVTSFLFSLLIQGGNFLQSSLQIPASISLVLQGIIIFFVLGSEFFLRYRLVWTRARTARMEN